MRSGRHRRHELRGTISSAGFGSGDRFVVGWWDESPIGPFRDVMWATPDGTRRLLASSAAAADFVTAVYEFDVVDVERISGSADGRHLRLTAGELELAFDTSWGVHLGFVRPLWFTRWVEGPLAKALLDVRTHGRSPTGVREWYRASGLRLVRSGTASAGGTSLGVLGPPRPATGFGFSEPPNRPAIVSVHPVLEPRSDAPLPVHIRERIS